jgi:hypothetical protein
MAHDHIAARFLGTEPMPVAFVDNTRAPLGIEPEPATEANRDPFPSLSLMQQPARGFVSVAVVRRVQQQN